jgi:hypothetical protein
LKKRVKVALLLMAALTVSYVSMIAYVYASSTNDRNDVVYGAFEYDSEPSDWYTPEDLGIFSIIELGEGWLHVAVSKEDEPFPLQEEQPIFKYKDKFYQVSELWVTPGLPESTKGTLILAACGLGCGWFFAGGLFLTERKKG